MACPSCKSDIVEVRCPEIQQELESLRQLRMLVEKLALEVAENQGMANDERLRRQEDFYEGNLLALAMH